MVKLIYSAIASLDGYVEDAQGNFDWAAPDDQVHGFVNDLERPVGTYLYGRRMYETMVYWETNPGGGQQSAVARDFAQVWRAADKVVFSSSIDDVSSARTRILRDFDPDTIRALKASAQADISVGGPTLAAAAFAAGLIDECHLFLHPVIVGAGKRALPAGARLALELLDHHTFDSGVVHLHYRVGQPT